MKFFLSALLMLISYSVFAQTIITDRPDQTESSSAVPLGSLQIESGIVLTYSEDDTISIRNISAPSTLFRIGFLKGVELRIFHQLESNKLNQLSSTSGASDIELGIKLELLSKDDVNTEIALLSHVVLPSGSSTLTNDEYGTINKLCISHGVNDKVGIGYNVGYSNFGTGDGDLTYSLVMGISITDKLGVFIEPYGDLAEMTDHVANADAGFTYLIKQNLQLDFSFGTGINNELNYASAGVSWNISK